LTVIAQNAPAALGLTPLQGSQRLGIVLATCALLGLGLWVAFAQPYTSGSDFGYYLGLVGGCMMLTLLVYPLRKRWKILESAGSMKGWFAFHIVFGILGPVLVLFHSAFRLSSINGTIAFWSMVVVTLSGVVGRFIYLHVHVELDGRHATMKELERYLEKRADNVQHILDRLPEIRDSLYDYGKKALKEDLTTRERIWRFFSASWEKEILITTALRLVYKALKAQGHREGWSSSRLDAECKAYAAIITDFVRAIDDTARFAVWERLLEWWHVLHLPVILVLLVSGVMHVVAVHMY
jgi:hypothetical protein